MENKDENAKEPNRRAAEEMAGLRGQPEGQGGGPTGGPTAGGTSQGAQPPTGDKGQGAEDELSALVRVELREDGSCRFNVAFSQLSDDAQWNLLRAVAYLPFDSVVWVKVGAVPNSYLAKGSLPTLPPVDLDKLNRELEVPFRKRGPEIMRAKEEEARRKRAQRGHHGANDHTGGST